MHTTWLSGYEYDDNGNLKLDAQGHPIPTMEPHWIDHIPVGFYVLRKPFAHMNRVMYSPYS